MDPPNRPKPPNSAPPRQPAPASGQSSEPRPSGRVRHDERGNAIWDWVKDAGRNALEATSRLLKKLEVSHLDVEDTKDQELRLESDRDPGGGYDPYNQSSKTRGASPKKGR